MEVTHMPPNFATQSVPITLFQNDPSTNIITSIDIYFPLKCIDGMGYINHRNKLFREKMTEGKIR